MAKANTHHISYRQDTENINWNIKSNISKFLKSHVRIAWLTAREPSAFYDFTVFAQDYITKTEHQSQARARPVRALEVSRYQTDKFTTMKWHWNDAVIELLIVIRQVVLHARDNSAIYKEMLTLNLQFTDNRSR